VYGHDISDACTINPFYGAHPELQVGIDGVLHHYHRIGAFQYVGNLLNHERTGCGAGSDPEHVNAVFEGLFGMDGIGHFNADRKTGLLLHELHPFQPHGADAFKTARTGAGFPDSTPEDKHPVIFGQ